MKINHLNVEITKACNLNCNSCFNNSGKRQDYELSFESWKTVLDNFKELGGSSILITGGEPTIHPEINELLEYSLEKQFQTSILTNGYKIQAIHPEILEKLKRVQLSLDSVIPDFHNETRGKNSWENAISALQYLEQKITPIEVSSTISSGNIDQLEALAELTYGFGGKLLPRQLQTIGRASRELIGSTFSTDYKNIISGIKEKYGEDFVVGDFGNYLPEFGETHDETVLKKNGVITIHPTGKLRGLEGKMDAEFKLVA